MSTNSFAPHSILAANRSRSPNARGEVEQQLEESPPALGSYVTPPPSLHISKQLSSTNLDFLRLKRHRSNSYASTASPPTIYCRSSVGPALSNHDSLQTDASISAKVEVSNVPKTKFILATPNEVSMEIHHPAVKRPRAVSMARNDSTSMDSRVYSNDEILPENRHGSISGMFLPIHEGDLEEGLSQEESTMMTGKYEFKLKPKKRTVRGELFQ